MSSRRRDRSRERSRERSPRSRLRMDSYSSRNGRSKVTPPRSREIDSVMKKARRSDSQSTYWNKKLLEVEEKDPNRWRHSGYKELYHRTGSVSNSETGGSRSKSRSASRSRSPARSIRGRPKSPVAARRDSLQRARSPRNDSRPRTPRARSPRSPRRESRGRSPRRDSRARSPRRDSPRGGRSPRRADSRGRAIRSPWSSRKRTPVPKSSHRKQTSRGRSDSASSESSSSCSNESCSVCSPKRKHSKERDIVREKPRERSRERSIERKRAAARLRQMPMPIHERSRSRSFSVPRSSRPAEKIRTKVKAKRLKEKSVLKVNRAHIKVESDSDSSSERGSAVGVVSSMSGPKLSLSERFGRMAQWSVDRDLEHRNLRITAGDRLTVEMDSPPSPLYPPSLTSLGDLGSWDDVRVRYTYYKDRGYLRDLTLQDYIKWEQWWYKYQDWLDNDRSYERYNYYRRRL